MTLAMIPHMFLLTYSTGREDKRHWYAKYQNEGRTTTAWVKQQNHVLQFKILLDQQIMIQQQTKIQLELKDVHSLPLSLAQ